MHMNLSGILVVSAPADIDAVLAHLASIDGVEVDRVDRGSGRIVVVQEAADVAAEVAGFGRIRALPQVLSVDLVCHYFGDAPAGEPQIERVLASLAEPGATPGS